APDRFAVDVAQRTAVDGDLIRAAVGGGREAERAGYRDQLVEVGVGADDVEIDRVDPVRHDADAADDGAILVQRQSPRIAGEPERRTLRADGAGGRLPTDVGARQLAELHARQ